MKKFFVVLLSILMITGSLFAQGANEAKADVDLDAPVNLVIWTHEDPNRKALELELIDEFTAAHPNVTVDYQTYPSSKIKEMLTVAFSGGKGPDIFNQSQSTIRQFVVEGLVSELDPAWIGEKSLDDVINRYIPGALAPVQYEGALTGLPLEYTNLCIYLNKEVFKDAGLDPEKDYPKTWEEMMEVSEKIVKRDGDIITRRGFDFRYPSYNQEFLPMVEQMGGKLVSDDGKTAVIGDEAWLRLFNYLKEWGPNGKNLGSPTYTAARKVFDLNDGTIAMSDSGLYQEARMNKANPDFFNSDDWMVIPMPQWSDAKQHVTNHIGCHYYMVNGSIPEAKQIWAWRLLDFMLSHAEDYLARVNLVQPTYELFESETFKNIPYSDVFAADLEFATPTYYGPASDQIGAKFKSAAEAVMLQGEDPKAVLEKFRADVQEILDDNQ